MTNLSSIPHHLIPTLVGVCILVSILLLVIVHMSNKGITFCFEIEIKILPPSLKIKTSTEQGKLPTRPPPATKRTKKAPP